MTPDATTVIAYSAGLFTLICLFFMIFLRQAKRSVSRIWFGMPFAFGAMAGAMLIRPEGLWSLRLGAFFAILAYGAFWQMARMLNERRPLVWIVLGICSVWLAFSVLVVRADQGIAHLLSVLLLALIGGLFTALAAREFWKGRDSELPAAVMLFRVFAAYAGLEFLRAPFVAWLPAPLGVAPTETWSVLLYNLGAVTLALLVSAFIIALLSERIAAAHHRLALQDPLTGAGNRRAFELRMNRQAGEGNRTMALIVFDIDRFKAINDQYGHAVGDLVIIRAAEVARKVLRRPDMVFRIGGEEFACLLEDVTEQEAFAVGERLRQSFEQEAQRIQAASVYATMSIGVASRRWSDGEAKGLFARADAALYRAKRGGRNRVIAANG